MLFWIWAVTLLCALALYLHQIYSRFSRHGVKYFTPLPFLGVVLRLTHFVDEIETTYKAFPNERFVGKFEFLSPVVVLRDLELVKKVIIKDFEYFLDHRISIDKGSDPIFGRNLFSLKGQEWKDMRSTMSPAFTSSKIRVMVPFMVEAGSHMVQALRNKIKESGGDNIEIDVKELTTRYANDIIASCAFGFTVDSYADQENLFYMKAKEASTFKFKQMLLFFLFASCPWLMNKLKMSFFSENAKKFFRGLVMDSMRDREARNVIRPDMIHLLMEAKKGNLVHEEKETADADAGFATVEESSVGKRRNNRAWSDDDLVAQVVVFFIAGFETVSSTMAFLLHELAVNPEVQEKLVKEIKANDERNGGKFDYNSIQEMKYLDMVVSELLRLWSPAGFMDRICLKDYNLGKPNDQATEDFILRKGDGVSIPVWGFHRNPEYFPNPLKFDPERFSEENKHNIKPFTYMPFGLGPRNCIGSRFALCEVKVMAYQLLQHFQLSPGPRTQIPATLTADIFNLQIKGGHWVQFRVRN